MKKIILMALLFCMILEASPLKTRALHLVIRGGEDASAMQDLIMYAKENHFNTLILMIVNGVALDSMPWLKNKKKIWSKERFKTFISFAKSQGFDIIPEVKFLTHQQLLFAVGKPEFLFNKTTYDVHNESVYENVFNIIDELISITRCQIFHIGHDEVAGNNYHIGRKWISLYERFVGKIITPKEYLYDIQKINTYLNKKGVRTMIWGDMFLNPKQFPTMLKKHLNGTSGFDKVIKNLSRNIIIADWHYFDEQINFPSSRMFADEGFTVFGSTWKRKETTKHFTQYIRTLNSGDTGMVLTTWYIPTGEKKTLIKDLIKYSGEVFYNEK